MKPADGTYLQHRTLVDGGLPFFVRRQRRLEARLLPFAPLVLLEKACRADIDTLLMAAGFTANNTGVTCAGYDVLHNHRDGRTSLDRETLKAQLLAAGVHEQIIDDAIAVSTDTGDPSNYALVRPMKGAKVRT